MSGAGGDGGDGADNDTMFDAIEAAILGAPRQGQGDALSRAASRRERKKLKQQAAEVRSAVFFGFLFSCGCVRVRDRLRCGRVE